MVSILLTPRMIVVGFVVLAAAFGLFLMPVGADPPQQPPYPPSPVVSPEVVAPTVVPTEEVAPTVAVTPVAAPPTGAGTGGGNSWSTPLIAISSALALAAGAAVVWRIGSRQRLSS